MPISCEYRINDLDLQRGGGKHHTTHSHHHSTTPNTPITTPNTPITTPNTPITTPHTPITTTPLWHPDIFSSCTLASWTPYGAFYSSLVIYSVHYNVLHIYNLASLSLFHPHTGCVTTPAYQLFPRYVCFMSYTTLCSGNGKIVKVKIDVRIFKLTEVWKPTNSLLILFYKLFRIKVIPYNCSSCINDPNNRYLLQLIEKFKIRSSLQKKLRMHIILADS